MFAPSSQASSTPPSILTLVVLVTPTVGPHCEIFNRDTIAWLVGRTNDVDWCTNFTICTSALPIVECEVGVEYSVAGCKGRISPVGVQIQRIGVRVADEVLENTIWDDAVPTVGLEHHHVVRLPSVDFGVGDLRDVGVDAEGTNGRAAGPVTVDILDEEVIARVL
jgi:hypothetical protein